MALKAVVATIDEIDEGLRSHYKEKDGAFYLDLEEFGKHPGAVTLKKTLDTLNRDKTTLTTEVNNLKTKFGALVEDEDFTVEGYEKLKTSGGGKDEGAALAALRESHAATIAKMKKDHETAMAERDGRISSLDNYIDGNLVDNGLRDALLDNGVNPDLLDGAVASLKSRVKVVKDGEVRKAVVETDMGDLGVNDFVKDWAKDKGKPYLGKASGPGGEGGDKGRRNSAPKGDFGGNQDDRRKAIANKFPELNAGR